MVIERDVGYNILGAKLNQLMVFLVFINADILSPIYNVVTSKVNCLGFITLGVLLLEIFFPLYLLNIPPGSSSACPDRLQLGYNSV